MDRRTEKGLTIQVTDCEELSPMEQEYNLMKKHHTYSRVLAPIFSRDHLSGFIGMDHFYKGISELFIHQLAFVGAHLNTARENLRMFTLLGKNLESMEKERQILNVLCEDCTSVYKVNLLDDTAEVVKTGTGCQRLSGRRPEMQRSRNERSHVQTCTDRTDHPNCGEMDEIIDIANSKCERLLYIQILPW